MQWIRFQWYISYFRQNPEAWERLAIIVSNTLITLFSLPSHWSHISREYLLQILWQIPRGTITAAVLALTNWHCDFTSSLSTTGQFTSSNQLKSQRPRHFIINSYDLFAAEPGTISSGFADCQWRDLSLAVSQDQSLGNWTWIIIPRRADSKFPKDQ